MITTKIRVPGGDTVTGTVAGATTTTTEDGGVQRTEEEITNQGEVVTRVEEGGMKAGEEGTKAGEEGTKVGEEVTKVGEEGTKVGEEGTKVGEEVLKADAEGMKVGGEVLKADEDLKAKEVMKAQGEDMKIVGEAMTTFKEATTPGEGATTPGEGATTPGEGAQTPREGAIRADKGDMLTRRVPTATEEVVLTTNLRTTPEAVSEIGRAQSILEEMAPTPGVPTSIGVTTDTTDMTQETVDMMPDLGTIVDLGMTVGQVVTRPRGSMCSTRVQIAALLDMELQVRAAATNMGQVMLVLLHPLPPTRPANPPPGMEVTHSTPQHSQRRHLPGLPPVSINSHTELTTLENILVMSQSWDVGHGWLISA